MKKSIILILFAAFALTACGPQQRIANYWVNKEALPKGPYKSIFIIAMTENKAAQAYIEGKMADVLNSRGRKAVLFTELFPPSFTGSAQLSREELAEKIASVGCDGVITMALLDVTTVETYQPPVVSSAPVGYGYGYGGYYGYYNTYYPVVYSPGYYTVDNTYLIETNFYDVVSDELIWSIRSEAYNPVDLETWFNGFSKLLLDKLRSEGLIQD